MQKTQPDRNPLNRAQRRFLRARPGSVLILVVALLILMAIIGTAYMSMAQADRTTAALHTNNTEIDLLLDGVVNMLKGNVVGELFAGGGKFRNQQASSNFSGYNNFNGIGVDATQLVYNQNAGSRWLDDRLPIVPNMANPPSPLGGGNEPLWTYITAPLAGTQFSTPYWNPNAQVFLEGQTALPAGNPYVYTQRDSFRAAPASRLLPGYILLNGTYYPAWCSPNGNTNAAILAADTDGDGVADAGYFKLPIGSINGVTYYAAVRIIDNAAAINVNTATWPNSTTAIGPNGAPFPGDFFPTSINFQRFVINPDNFLSVLAYRNNPNFNITGPFSPVDDIDSTVLGNVRPDFSYFVDTNTPLSVTQNYAGLDMFWTQLGRRLDNPGRIYPGVPLQSASINESIIMARNFVLQDPSVNSASSSSFLEQLLPNTTKNNSPSSPYTPTSAGTLFNAVPQWFQDNFTYYSAANQDQIKVAPARPLFVSRNPVTNFAPNKFQLRDASIGIAKFGDYLTINGRAYVYTGPPIGGQIGQYPPGVIPYPTQLASALPPPTGVTYPTPLLDSFWAPEPWTDAPTKISVNTGTFNQLWTAYWSLMTDTNIVPSFDPGLGLGLIANTNWGVPYGTQSRQFFSPIRDPSIGYTAPAALTQVTPKTPRQNGRPTPMRFGLLPAEVVKLRSAIAAANTVALRSQLDCTINSHRIFLVGQRTYDGSTQSELGGLQPTLVQANVYGNKPQPYIVSVYAENDNVTAGGGSVNPQGYVGVQLYNPYPFDINLQNCKLGIIQGRRITDTAGTSIFPNMVIAPITGFPIIPANTGVAGQTPVVPAGGYLVLENFAGGAALQPNDALYRPLPVAPTPATGDDPPFHKYFYVPNLSEVMQNPGNPAQRGGELVLLRPRVAIPRTTTIDPLQFPVGPSILPGEYDENQLADMIPLDSFDFSALQVAPGPMGPFTGIYYRRVGDPLLPINKWKWVYPGRWDPSQPWPSPAPIGFNQEGTEVALWTNAGNSTTPDTAVFAPQLPIVWDNNTVPPIPIPTFTVLPTFPAIQLFNTDFPGPNATPNGIEKQFPYGMFARNGDILQSPFIGAYTIKEIRSVDPATGFVTYPPYNAGNPNIIVEMNPVTLDSQQADDYDDYPAAGGTSDNVAENIGRFCPIDIRDFIPVPPVPYPVDDFSPLPPADNTVNTPFWRYHWAMQLLDYLTVQSPQDDQFPALDPLSNPFPPQPVNHKTNSAPAPQTYGRIGSMTGNVISVRAFMFPAANYTNTAIQFLTGPARGTLMQVTGAVATNIAAGAWNVSIGSPLPTVLPQPNDLFVIYGAPEPTQSLNGLVNINTASWRVLAAVPFLPGAGVSGPQQTLNSEIAFSIIYYRDFNDGTSLTPPFHGHGPFRNLFELNRVPIVSYTGVPFNITFRDMLRPTPGTSLTADFTNAEGDLSPFGGAATDGITGDFEGTFLMMNRISNLLTTRSDSYTAYILLEGWQDAETANPKLVVRRRAAYIIDRTGVTPTNSSPTLTNIPTSN